MKLYSWKNQSSINNYKELKNKFPHI